jgi:hypothetical protein
MDRKQSIKTMMSSIRSAAEALFDTGPLEIKTTQASALFALPGHTLFQTPLRELAGAGSIIPDKEAMGYEGVASLNEAHRDHFAAEGESRRKQRRWDNLFPTGADDIMDLLSEQAKSTEP